MLQRAVEAEQVFALAVGLVELHHLEGRKVVDVLRDDHVLSHVEAVKAVFGVAVLQRDFVEGSSVKRHRTGTGWPQCCGSSHVKWVALDYEQDRLMQARPNTRVDAPKLVCNQKHVVSSCVVSTRI